MLASSSLGEKSIEGIVATSYGFVRRHLTIRLNSVLKAVKLPARIAALHSGLTNMNRKALTHFKLLR